MTTALLRRGILFALLWWVLSEGRAGSRGLGAVAVAAALWASVRLLPPESGRISLAGLIAFLGYFIWNSVRGGAQVALIALRGRQALQPDMLEMQLSLPSGASRIRMVNALGLMPGSLGERLEGDRHQAPDFSPRAAWFAGSRAGYGLALLAAAEWFIADRSLAGDQADLLPKTTRRMRQHR